MKPRHRLIALALLALPPSARAVTVLEYRGALSADPPLGRPITVTVDPATMNICVTDEATQVIGVFDATGFQRFRTDATSALRMPEGGAIDARGDFVFTDLVVDTTGSAVGRRTIRRLNFLGEPMDFEPEPPTPRWYPNHLLLARNGDLVTIDRTGLLARHDDSGKLLWTAQVAEREWEGVELLGAPAEREDGTFLIPGASLRRMIRVSGDGQDKSAFGVPGTKRGELAFPVAVAVAPGGQALVVDRMRHKILVFDGNDAFVEEFSHLGFRPGELYYPLAIATAPDGRVFVAQGYEGRVQIFHLFDTAHFH